MNRARAVPRINVLSRPVGGASLATLVQTTGAKFATNVSGQVHTLTFPGNVTAGNAVILTLVHYQTFGADPVLGGTTASLAVTRLGGDTNYNLSIWYALNVTGGTPNVVISLFNSGSYFYLSAEEWSGISAAALDKTSSDKTTSTASAVTTSALVQSKELAYACAMMPATTLAGPTGGTWTQTVINNNGVDLPFAAAYKKLSSSSAVTANWTASPSAEIGSVVATFKTI